MASIFKITFILLMVVLIINFVQGAFTDVPPPPKRPEKFHTKEELKTYLQKLHEYYSIVGRWRIRRGFDDHLLLPSSNDALFKFFDINHDQVISHSEFARRLKDTNGDE